MERAYVRPHVRTLSQMVLAVRAFKSLRYAAFVFVMPRHVTTVFIAAVTVRALMTRQSVLDVIDVMGALQGPLQERIWKKRVYSWLVRKSMLSHDEFRAQTSSYLSWPSRITRRLPKVAEAKLSLELRDISRECVTSRAPVNTLPVILLRYRRYCQRICTIEKVTVYEIATTILSKLNNDSDKDIRT